MIQTKPLTEHEDDELSFVCPGCGEFAAKCTCGGEAGWLETLSLFTALVFATGLWAGLVWWFASWLVG